MAFDLEVIDEDIVMASFYSEKFRKVLSLKDTDLEFVEEVEDQAETQCVVGVSQGTQGIG
ncbi:hypothetical protein HRED_08538, partial [Candidatus Haloredivivus sp. G17]